jgi:hypothetical protein
MINEASGLDFGIARKAIVEAAFVLLPGRRLDLDVVVTPGQIGHNRVLPQRLQNDPRLSVLRQDGLAHRRLEIANRQAIERDRVRGAAQTVD